MINIENYLRVNVTDMVMVLISTFLIVVITKKFFWNNVKEYLDKRQYHIQSQLDDAKNSKVEGEEYLKEAREKLSVAQKQSEEIITKATNESKKIADEIVLKAKQEAIKEKTRAKEEIELEKEEAISDMKNEISDIAFTIAKKLIKKETDEQVQKKYIEDFLKEAQGNGR